MLKDGHQLMKKIKNCIDCHKSIHYTSKRCKSCAAKARAAKRYFPAKIILICNYCYNEFKRCPSQVGNGNHFCSIKHFHAWWTEQAGGWGNKGSYRTISIDGIEVQEHRYIMEQHINRSLKKDKVVHHINGNPSDNRIENLEIMSRSEHTSLHNMGKSRTGIKHRPRTKEQKHRIRQAALNRPPVTNQTKKKISNSMKKVRAEKFWSSRK